MENETLNLFKSLLVLIGKLEDKIDVLNKEIEILKNKNNGA